MPGLKEKLSDGIISFKTRGVTADSLKEIKAQGRNAIANKRENAQALIDEYEYLPFDERIPLFALSFQAVFKTSVRIQS